MSAAEKVAAGIAILVKYPNAYVAAEHDELWFGPEDESLVSDEDKKALEALGWHKQDGFGWHHYV